ncbi:hypothetical protein [Streptomyces sp. NPDC058739]|uniref:hypothetical protein n=1 Tax=Streptomyces sp. NPDC058739 TaxID=3346618 RepID=UPI00367CE274
MNKRMAAVAAVGLAGLVTGTLSVSQASADPSGPPQYRQLAGVGSDTTQDVMNGLANAITIGGQKVIGSYDATGSASITTKATGCTLARPNGSGAGRTALVNSLGAGNGCLDFSRSSSLNLATTANGLTYVPFAVDAATYAITPSSVVPRKLTQADLTAIYHCDPNYVGTGPNYDVTPLLPQAGSGTRGFWMGQVGITEADMTANNFPCVKNTENGPVQGAFFLAEQGTPGAIVEHGATGAMFSTPQDPRTADYVEGRFG